MLLVGLASVGLRLVADPAWAEYQSKGKRDPFVPLLTKEGQRVYPPGTDEELTSGEIRVILQGIVFDPKADSYAVINGKVVREKEEIEGVKVLKIEPERVTILVEGKPQLLTLRQFSKGEASGEVSEEERVSP